MGTSASKHSSGWLIIAGSKFCLLFMAMSGVFWLSRHDARTLMHHPGYLAPLGMNLSGPYLKRVLLSASPMIIYPVIISDQQGQVVNREYIVWYVLPWRETT